MNYLNVVASNVHLPDDYQDMMMELSYYVKNSTGPNKRYFDFIFNLINF